MYVNVYDFVELEDGSATMQVEMDNEMKEFLLEKAFMDIITTEAMKVIASVDHTHR